MHKLPGVKSPYRELLVHVTGTTIPQTGYWPSPTKLRQLDQHPVQERNGIVETEAASNS